ncbi:hypothetical protein CD149_00455 [Staphylococcus condimenti]|uniref:Uncharacterized protein n=1 Tax=Staphylococcus condimenti TaxID=70255 RepID=A0A143P9Q3_9STAP|nr:MULTISPECIES: hypothetical protein [Staphylococcus]AMY05100.1 hypothetical protein A4G25_03805 [Staphylococcus condimenti]APR61293.1 hypothetical protein BTZ13_08750 [Staphylococcus condimenti]MDK8645789.1 hypothetical protein [Staphylococcus condimenti]OFP02363.1 hypothetical protein HMPREF3007_03730 [Staphylococcus sp. HMSC065E08]PNZ64147.1 hypothetical protein CD149_00455 [Staphylococcus condimenti]
MKKVLFLLLASFLVLAACGQKEESKSEDKKSESKKKDSKAKKGKEDKKKSDKKEMADNQQKENSDQQVYNSEQPTVQPDNTQQVEAPQQTNEQQPVQQEQNVQPTQQAPVNTARQQALNEGIDFDNPTPAQIERMRELSKQSPYGMQEPTLAGPME